MRPLALFTLGTAAVCFVAAPATARADILCKTKKGGLVVREACKKKETALQAADLAGLGLGGGGTGPAGPAGPTGPQGPQGPRGLNGISGSGGGLTVVDADGQDVGIVRTLNDSYYGSSAATATVLRQAVAAGSSEPEWFSLPVNTNGFVTGSYGSEYSAQFTTSDCTGPKYFGINCDYGSCAAAPFAIDAFLEPDGKTAYFARESERQTLQFYGRSTISSNDPNVAALCTNPQFGGIPGIVLRQTYACGSDGLLFCVDCCTPFGSGSPLAPTPTEGSPIRTLDLSGLGLHPPFRLNR